jgi:ribosomal protein L16 Arg81 hydroxylase
VDAELNPGDLIYIPSDWWHAVRNAEDGVAITYNIVNISNYARVFRVYCGPFRSLEKVRATAYANYLEAIALSCSDGDFRRSRDGELLLALTNQMQTTLRDIQAMFQAEADDAGRELSRIAAIIEGRRAGA